jgi:uncharacterized protein (DUF4415 family)
MNGKSSRGKTLQDKAYTQDDMDDVADNPPLNDHEMAQARPFREAFPDTTKTLEKAIAARGRPRLDKPKQPVNIRLDADILEHYKAEGQGWQSRINDILRKAAGL